MEVITPEVLALILSRSDDNPTAESCKPVGEVADVRLTGVPIGCKEAEAVQEVSLFVRDARAGRPSLSLRGVCFDTALSTYTSNQPADESLCSVSS